MPLRSSHVSLSNALCVSDSGGLRSGVLSAHSSESRWPAATQKLRLSLAATSATSSSGRCSTTKGASSRRTVDASSLTIGLASAVTSPLSSLIAPTLRL